MKGTAIMSNACNSLGGRTWTHANGKWDTLNVYRGTCTHPKYIGVHLHWQNVLLDTDTFKWTPVVYARFLFGPEKLQNVSSDTNLQIVSADMKTY